MSGERRRKPNPYVMPSPQGTFSVYEMLRFLSVAERKYHYRVGALGNFRINKKAALRARSRGG